MRVVSNCANIRCMGSMLQVSCSQCGHESQEYVGVGMMNVGLLLFACDSCHGLVNVSQDWSVMAPTATGVPCGECGSVMRLLAPRIGRRGHDMGDLGRCPKCPGHLFGSDVGIWD